MIRTDQLIDKGNGYKAALSNAINDLTLMALATDYRTTVSRRYRMLPARSLPTLAGASEYVCSTKYDGEGVFAYVDTTTDTAFFFNAPSGRVRIGLPCQKELLAKLKEAKIKKALLVGELYLKGLPGKSRTQVGDVIHVSFNGNAAEVARLSFAGYDIIMLDGKDQRPQQSNFEVIWNKLGEILGTKTTDAIHRVEGVIVTGSELEAEFKKITGLGEEGVVIRNLTTTDIYKVKPSLTIDVIALGYVEGDYEGQYGVTSILTGLIDPKSGRVVAFFRVGSGFNDDQRRQLLEPLGRLKTASPISMTDSDGRPISFTTPGIILEIEGESLQKETHSGKPSTSQGFLYDAKAKTYSFTGIVPCPLFSHATFVRVRDDKTWQDGGARLEQVFSDTEVQNLLNPTAADATPHPDKVVHRQLWTKTLKGEQLVHKLLVIASTNPSHYPYTLVYTDFSPGRAEPLKKKVLVASSSDRIKELLVSYQGEASGKGWVDVANPLLLT